MPKGYFTPFTEDQKKTIKAEYLKKPVKRLADELGTTYGRIMRFLAKNNLHIPPALIEQRKKASQKQPGNTPFNKGMKQTEYMSAVGIAKSKQSRFKKGTTPHNTNPFGNGAIVLRKDTSGETYKYIRIKPGVWDLYHRIVWQQHNGIIPPNHIVVFKDGNSLNTNIKNLKLINRSINILRNSKHNYPSEIIPSMVLNKKLQNQINKLENGKK